MSRMPNFSHKFVQRNKKLICLMHDDGGDGISLTNGIEEAVKRCKLHAKPIGPIDYFIYQDSEGRWDGWDDKEQDFILLGSPKSEIRDEEEAIEAILNYYGVAEIQ